MKNILTTSVLAIGLFGCVGPVKYIPPIEGDIANLVIESTNGKNIVGFTYDEANFCTARKMIKRVNAPSGIPIIIRANQEISVSLGWDTKSTFDGVAVTYSGCNPTVTFQPEKNQTYIIKPATKDPNLCEVEVYKNRIIIENKINVKKRIYTSGTLESSSFCK